MDVNGDGRMDILSGSYSRKEKDMAGLFQVLFGEADGTFRAPEVLTGSDGKPLILATGQTRDGKENVTDKICTRPFAVDLNGDGKLDIVSGNFSGTFGFFAGEGEGRFAPTNTLLMGPGDKPLRVGAHSDPFLIDWDGDGDYDLVSGSARGGVFLWSNEGSQTEPSFGAQTTLLAPVQRTSDLQLGDAHLTGPQSDTRVWVADVDRDGKLDLLVGDTVTLHFPAKGLDAADVKTRVAEWEEALAKLMKSRQVTNGTVSNADMKQFQEDYQALQKERASFVRDERTGFVWLLRQK